MNNRNNKNKRPILNLLPYIIVISFLVLMLFSNPIGGGSAEITYSSFSKIL